MRKETIHRPAEPLVKVIPPCPEWMSCVDAQWAWNRLWQFAIDSQRLYRSSEPLVIEFCCNWSRLVQAERALVGEELVTERVSREGTVTGLVEHPQWSVLQRCQTALRDLSRALGIRPQDIHGVTVEDDVPRPAIDIAAFRESLRKERA